VKIYTKTGDDGTTGLLGGTRVAKTAIRIQAIGDVDELNASLALSWSAYPKDIIRWIQNCLFDLGAELASLPEGRIQSRTLTHEHAQKLEESMDAMAANLPPLRNFILPGGSEASARLHISRAVCRRAERSVLSLHAVEPQRDELLVFLNRLSDWLFLAARDANASQDLPDIAWQQSEVS
jgi:cob(I)alamin adenosyltransferase